MKEFIIMAKRALFVVYNTMGKQSSCNLPIPNWFCLTTTNAHKNEKAHAIHRVSRHRFLFAGTHFNFSDKRIENHSNRKSALKLRNGKTMKGGNLTLTNDHNVKISRFVTSENSYNGTRQKKNSSTKNNNKNNTES